MATKKNAVTGKIVVVTINGNRANDVRGSVMKIVRVAREKVTSGVGKNKKEITVERSTTVGKVNLGAKNGNVVLVDLEKVNTHLTKSKEIMSKATGYELSPLETQKLINAGEFSIRDVEKIVG